MRAYLTCVLGAASVVAAAIAPAASADNLNSVVRNLNAILNPDDARRLEDQARRNNRPEEERYWRNYGAGLEQQRHAGPPPRGGGVSPDEARRLEAQARRNGRWEEERYWHNYLAGLEGPRAGPGPGPGPGPGYRGDGPRPGRIGPEEAARLEERARRDGRWDEVRYWASYRAGLEGRR